VPDVVIARSAPFSLLPGLGPLVPGPCAPAPGRRRWWPALAIALSVLLGTVDEGVVGLSAPQ
jgi:hypothetical protein